MINEKIWWMRILLGYLKLTLGTIITFYNFGFNSPYEEILHVLGVLVMVTSGLKIKFIQDFETIVKPS